LMRVADGLRDEPFEFTVIGPTLAETAHLLGTARPNVTVLPKRPQAELPDVYSAADVFLFPTIQDGFGMGLTQARAAGLPVITTPNGGGPDVVADGQDGWIVPIRQPDAIAERLRWCGANRWSLAAMARTLDDHGLTRDWSDVGRDFVTIGRELLGTKGARRS